MDLNQQETEKTEKKKEYQEYKQWLKDNGVIIDQRIRYPSVFGGHGLVGVSASKPIEKGRAIVAIPYKLLITVEKVKGIEQFRKIIEQNTDVFSVKEDRPFMILVLYISAELLKGEKSFYFPYFRIAESSGITSWTHWDITALENKQLGQRIKDQKEELQRIFVSFLRIYRRYENIFPAQLSNTQYKELFQKAHTMISTRAFGWSLPSISMIPLADSFNHGLSYLDHYLVDTELEMNQKAHDKTQMKGYVSRKKTANLSILNKPELKPTEQQLDLIRKVRPSRKYKFIQKHKQILGEEPVAPQDKKDKIQKQHLRILHQQYKAGVRNFRQLHFYESSCSEDNDTDEETLYEQTFQEEAFILDERNPVGETLKINQKNKGKHIRKYWKLFTDKTFKYEESESEEQSGEQEMEEKPNQEKVAKQKPKPKFKDQEGSACSSSVSDTSGEDDDEDFTWAESRDLDSMYLVMQTKKIVRQNQQLYNFYGRRSNKFLLLAYNFVMGADNSYDSFAFRMRTDFQNIKLLSPEKILYEARLSHKAEFTRQIRLKASRISTELVNHCRCWVVHLTKLENEPKLTISIPFNLQIQRKSLGLAKDVLRFMAKSYMTTPQEDEQIIEKAAQTRAAKPETITAIRYRLNQKRIIEAQLELLDLCLEYLKRWKKGRLEIAEAEMQSISKVRQYLCQLERGKL